MLFTFVITPILVGIVAQKWKKRTGAAWAAITLVPAVILYVLSALAMDIVSAGRGASQQEADLALSMMAGSLTLALMLLIVATLPKRD